MAESKSKGTKARAEAEKAKNSQPEAPETEPTEPSRDVHPNEVRGPIELQFNMEREQLVEQYREARQALEAEHRQKLAENATAKRDALEEAGLTRGGAVRSEHSERMRNVSNE